MHIEGTVSMPLAEVNKLRDEIYVKQNIINDQIKTITDLESNSRIVKITTTKNIPVRPRLVIDNIAILKAVDLYRKSPNEGLYGLQFSAKGYDRNSIFQNTIKAAISYESSDLEGNSKTIVSKEYTNFEDVKNELREVITKELVDDITILRKNSFEATVRVEEANQKAEKEIAEAKRSYNDLLKTLREKHIKEIDELNQQLDDIKNDKVRKTKEQQIEERLHNLIKQNEDLQIELYDAKEELKNKKSWFAKLFK